MIFTFKEMDHVFYCSLVPENVKEASELLRLANNSKVENINFVTSFNKEINTHFFINKSKNIKNVITTKEKIK